ncbi:MAG TPA: hypothetical protein VEA69_24125 [Tepidisphaeraceae bacterium]|nr:hypothetical protein [Tepidisphaeraceae bacterium]
MTRVTCFLMLALSTVSAVAQYPTDGRTAAYDRVEELRRELDQARADRELAKSRALRVVLDMTREFEQSPELWDSVVGQRRLMTALEDAREAALQDLRETSRYQTAKAAAEQSRTALENLSPNATPFDRQNAATAALRAADVVTKMERAVANPDPALVAARDRLIEATSAMRARRADFDRSIRESSSWQAAQAEIAAADRQIASAQVALASARREAAEAGRRPTAPVQIAAGRQQGPSTPSTPTLAEKRCSACHKVVSNGSAAGQRCPHCGVYWSAERVRVVSR